MPPDSWYSLTHPDRGQEIMVHLVGRRLAANIVQKKLQVPPNPTANFTFLGFDSSPSPMVVTAETQFTFRLAIPLVNVISHSRERKS